jgi:hypothetical protein
VQTGSQCWSDDGALADCPKDTWDTAENKRRKAPQDCEVHIIPEIAGMLEKLTKKR